MRLFENTGKKLTEAAFNSKKTDGIQKKADELGQKKSAIEKEQKKLDKELVAVKDELKKVAQELRDSKADDSIKRMRAMQDEKARKANI